MTFWIGSFDGASFFDCFFPWGFDCDDPVLFPVRE